MPMTCQELAEFLMDYLDGRLSDGLKAQFEEHLAECPDCVRYMLSYQQTVRIGKAV
jgi:anti-sigma factor RsiW